jgi:protein phosphatase
MAGRRDGTPAQQNPASGTATSGAIAPGVECKPHVPACSRTQIKGPVERGERRSKRSLEYFMDTDTREDDTPQAPVATVPPDPLWPETGSSQVEVDLAAISDRGLVRENNQDHYLVVRIERSMQTLLTNLQPGQVPARAEEVAYGLVVADGMGGPAGGEIASQLAITTLVSLALHTPDWVLGIRPKDTRRRMQRMAERWRLVQEALRQRGDREPALGQMGTTMIAAVSLGTRLVLGHVGDSRVYVFRQGELHQLTRDHTLVQTMVELGQLTPGQAATHPQRHMLMRSFNAAGYTAEGDFQQVLLADGDQLLLCTDGLTDMVDTEGISWVLSKAASADEACQALLACALKNGGKDNVTIALARYRFPRSAAGH